MILWVSTLGWDWVWLVLAGLFHAYLVSRVGWGLAGPRKLSATAYLSSISSSIRKVKTCA